MLTWSKLIKKYARYTSRKRWSLVHAGHVLKSLDVQLCYHWLSSRFFVTKSCLTGLQTLQEQFFYLQISSTPYFLSSFTVFLVLLLWGLSLRGWWYHRRHSALHKIRSLVLAKNCKELKTQKKKIKLLSLKLGRYKASWAAAAITPSFIVISFSYLSLKLFGSYQTPWMSRSLEWRLLSLLFV